MAMRPLRLRDSAEPGRAQARVLLLALFLLFAALVTWLVSSNGGDSSGETDAQIELAPAPANERLEPSNTATFPSRTPSERGPGVSRRVRIRAIDGCTGRVRPGATILQVPVSRELLESGLDPSKKFAELARLISRATPLTRNAQGELPLPAEAGAALLAARHGDLLGWYFGPSEQPIEIVMHRNYHVVVQTRGPGGNAIAGIPVRAQVLTKKAGDPDPMPMDGSMIELGSTRGEEGLLELSLLPWLVDQDPLQPGEERQLLVQIASGETDAQPERIALRQKSQLRMVLHTQALGSVLVRLHERHRSLLSDRHEIPVLFASERHEGLDGQKDLSKLEVLFEPVAVGGRFTFALGPSLEHELEGPTRPGEQVILDLADAATGTVRVRILGLEPLSGLRCSLTGGKEQWPEPRFEKATREFVFEHVPTGLQMLFAYQHRGEWFSTKFSGPSRAGQVLRQSHRHAPPIETVLSLLDETGKPLPNAEVKVRVQSRGLKRFADLRWQTDQAGKIRTVWRPKKGEVPMLLALELFHSRGALGLRAEQLLGLRLGPGRKDLGRFRLRPMPLVAKCRVSFQGKPASRRQMPVTSVECFDSERGRWHRPRSPRPWVSRSSGAKTREQGWIRVFGELSPGRYRLCLRPPGETLAPLAPIEFSPGGEELSAELQLSAGFCARVRLPGAADVERIRLRLVPEANGYLPEELLVGKPNVYLQPSNGRGKEAGFTWVKSPAESTVEQPTIPFAWRQLPAGKYTLVIEESASDKELLRHGGLVLQSGQLHTDSRSWPLDLRMLLSN